MIEILFTNAKLELLTELTEYQGKRVMLAAIAHNLDVGIDINLDAEARVVFELFKQ